MIPALCCGVVNRGLAVLGDTLYMGTIDAHLVAVDDRTGRERWHVEVADARAGYSMTAAPLALRNSIVVGTSVFSGVGVGDTGGDLPESRGRIAAYDPQTGRLQWQFYPVPAPGEPGSETWGRNDFWRIAGSSTWMTGSYDPDLNLLYWGTGAPNYPPYTKMRPGDNLYTASVVALDGSTGRLRWYFQFTPHDTHDWDAAQNMVLADLPAGDRSRKVLLTANRNGFFYVLDRETGAFLLGKPFARQTWADGIDSQGRPIKKPNIDPTVGGTRVSPANDGGTNWWSPSFSPSTRLFYVTARDSTENYMIPDFPLNTIEDVRSAAMTLFKDPARMKKLAEAFASHIDVASAVHALRALDPATGLVTWEFPLPGRSTAGVLSTAADLVFTGSTEADVFALDARTGAQVWRRKVDGWIHAGPTTYKAGGRQFVTVASSTGLYTFGLP
jgi:alcohol dehydrogenase (cytochrome c)